MDLSRLYQLRVVVRQQTREPPVGKPTFVGGPDTHDGRDSPSSWSAAHAGPLPPPNDLSPSPTRYNTGYDSTRRQRTHRVKTSGNVGRRASAVRQLALARVARVAGGVGGGRRSRQRALILGEGGEAKGEDDEERFGQHPGRPCEERSRGRMRLRGGWWWSKKERSD